MKRDDLGDLVGETRSYVKSIVDDAIKHDKERLQ